MNLFEMESFLRDMSDSDLARLIDLADNEQKRRPRMTALISPSAFLVGRRR